MCIRKVAASKTEYLLCMTTQIHGSHAHVYPDLGSHAHLFPIHGSHVHVYPDLRSHAHLFPIHGSNVHVYPDLGSHAHLYPIHGSHAHLYPILESHAHVYPSPESHAHVYLDPGSHAHVCPDHESHVHVHFSPGNHAQCTCTVQLSHLIFFQLSIYARALKSNATTKYNRYVICWQHHYLAVACLGTWAPKIHENYAFYTKMSVFRPIVISEIFWVYQIFRVLSPPSWIVPRL